MQCLGLMVANYALISLLWSQDGAVCLAFSISVSNKEAFTEYLSTCYPLLGPPELEQRGLGFLLGVGVS